MAKDQDHIEEKIVDVVEGDSVQKQDDSGPGVDYSESKVTPLPPMKKKGSKSQKLPKKINFSNVRRVTTIGTKAGTIFIVEDEDGVFQKVGD